MSFKSYMDYMKYREYHTINHNWYNVNHFVDESINPLYIAGSN